MEVLKSRRAVVCLFISVLLSGCGSESDVENTVLFTGRVLSVAENDLGSGIRNVEVCAVDVCDETNDTGNYSFYVDVENFSGGDVSYTLSGAVHDEALVTDINEGARLVEVNFTTEGGASVTSIEVSSGRAPGEK